MISRKQVMRSTPPSPDDQLAERVRGGSIEALGEMYGRYSAAVMSLALRFTGERADAEDVVHDVFLGLPEALRHYEERGNLESWLKRLAVRVALTRMRTERRRQEVALDGDGDLGQGESPDMRAATALLDRAILTLPGKLRTVFVLREIEGYSHAEIASLLSISTAASEVRLSRAIRQLRLRLVNER